MDVDLRRFFLIVVYFELLLRLDSEILSVKNIGCDPSLELFYSGNSNEETQLLFYREPYTLNARDETADFVNSIDPGETAHTLLPFVFQNDIAWTNIF